jgi:hypothetical protein
MKSIKRIFSVLCIVLTLPTALLAQGSGWTVNPHDYQYDMTVYAAIELDGGVVADYSNYEIAAFVNVGDKEECRGVATVDSQSGMTWLYMRIYSNKASGEEVRFKIYDKSKSKISSANEKITFESEKLVGMPSSPQKLSLVKFTLGDVNDDGKINAADIVAVKQIMAETASGNIIVDAADVNSDAKVNSADIVAIKKKMAE